MCITEERLCCIAETWLFLPTLLYSRDWHNAVNQLYINFKKLIKKKVKRLGNEMG